MSKAQIGEDEFRPDPKRTHPEIDKKVKLPSKVRDAAALAEALITGGVAPLAGQSNQGPPRKFQYTNAEIDRVLQDLDRGALKPTDRSFKLIIELAREGARHIKARRRGAQQPRETSKHVTRRMNALLEAYRELSPKLQATPTGARTVAALRQSVISKLNLPDNDDACAEDIIRKDIQQLSLIFKLVREGIIPRSGKPVKQPDIPDKTQLEMKAGAKAVARAANAEQSRPRSESKAK